MITPTVGRIVWFYRYVENQGHKGPLAAIVVDVHSDTCVNLSVFDQEGVLRPEVRVYLSQPNSDVPQADYCCWMPYQVKKATGSESGEKEAGTQAV